VKEAVWRGFRPLRGFLVCMKEQEKREKENVENISTVIAVFYDGRLWK